MDTEEFKSTLRDRANELMGRDYGHPMRTGEKVFFDNVIIPLIDLLAEETNLFHTDVGHVRPMSHNTDHVRELDAALETIHHAVNVARTMPGFKPTGLAVGESCILIRETLEANREAIGDMNTARAELTGENRRLKADLQEALVGAEGQRDKVERFKDGLRRIAEVSGEDMPIEEFLEWLRTLKKDLDHQADLLAVVRRVTMYDGPFDEFAAFIELWSSASQAARNSLTVTTRQRDELAGHLAKIAEEMDQEDITIDGIVEYIRETRELSHVQHTRMSAATLRMRHAGACDEDTLPDLGRVLGWLMTGNDERDREITKLRRELEREEEKVVKLEAARLGGEEAIRFLTERTHGEPWAAPDPIMREPITDYIVRVSKSFQDWVNGTKP